MKKKSPKKASVKITDTFENYSIVWEPNGKALEAKSEAEGWQCEWRTLGPVPAPTAWVKDGKRVAAFSTGKSFWITPPPVKVIAKIIWADEYM